MNNNIVKSNPSLGLSDISVQTKHIILIILCFFLHLPLCYWADLELKKALFSIWYPLSGYIFMAGISLVLYRCHKTKVASFFATFSSVSLFPFYLYLTVRLPSIAIIGIVVILLQIYAYSYNQRISKINNFNDETEISSFHLNGPFLVLLLSSLGLSYLDLCNNYSEKIFQSSPWVFYCYIALGIFIVIFSLYTEHIRFRFSFSKWTLITIINIIAIISFASATDVSVNDYSNKVFPLITFQILIISLRLWLASGGFIRFWNLFVSNPRIMFLSSIGGLIILGSILLTLPVMYQEGVQPLGLVDSFFMATSSTCVTGLSICNVAKTFTTMGQLTLLFMIQVGGLGVMTISIFIALLFNRDIGLRGTFSLGEMIGEDHCRSAQYLLKTIIFITIIIESIGAIALFIIYINNSSLTLFQSIFYSCFHSISAFCNAGIALHENGLVGLPQGIGFIISILFILGGLGFSVYYVIISYITGIIPKNTPLSLHMKIVLWSTFALCISGTILIMLLEWNNDAFGNYGFFNRLYHSWFQSTTTRTAGFNTVDFLSLNPGTILTMIIFMFIGSAPGSTGGGIKITSFFILLCTVKTFIKGEKNVIVMGRRLSFSSIIGAITLLLTSCGLIIVCTIIILLFGVNVDACEQIKESALSLSIRIGFLCTSAFGTVGLDLDLCDKLTNIGRLTTCALMFIGRIGPLTILSIFIPVKTKSVIRYPKDNIMIG